MTGRSGHVLAPDGVRIAWRLDGPAEGPAVALCTMATAAMSVWDGLVEDLASDWRVLRHDRRGDGDSDAGAPETHSFSTYARDAFAVMEACGVDAAHVCGMAFGSRVAVRMALDEPGRVRSLALFAATGAPPAPEAERRAGSVEAARLRAEAGLPRREIDRRWFARRDPAGAGLTREALRREPPWTERLDTITAPTLLACGEQDPNFAGAQRMAREIPGARFEAMPMTGHASILDRPDLVSSLLSSFLAEVEGGAKSRSAEEL
jgi:pimeloyl-ACP methyl ester carboxylesterase